MVDEEFGIHPEEFEEEVLADDRHPCHVAHGVHAVGFEPLHGAPSDAPEVGQRAVGPQCAAVAFLVEAGNAHPVGIGRDVFGHDVHSHLAEIEVGADACRGGDARLLQHIAHDGPCHQVGIVAVGMEIVRDVHENFVDRVDVDVLRCHIFQIDGIDVGAVADVECHARRCSDVAGLPLGMALECRLRGGTFRQPSFRRPYAPALVHLAHTLFHLKEPCASADAVFLERGGYGQTDGLGGTAGIGHHQMGVEGVEAALHALYRGVERFEVDGDVGTGRHKNGSGGSGRAKIAIKTGMRKFVPGGSLLTTEASGIRIPCVCV